VTRIIFVRSTDNGYTWDFLSEIVLRVEDSRYTWSDHPFTGINESDLLFLDNGDILCLYRTDGLLLDGKLAHPTTFFCGPMFKTVSNDGGRTWSKSVPFGSLGILPKFIKMDKCTLLNYGRPGVCVRFSEDEKAEIWSDEYRIELSGGDERTCANSEMIALDGNTAMLIYSDFDYPDENGCPRKSILTRKIHVVT